MSCRTVQWLYNAGPESGWLPIIVVVAYIDRDSLLGDLPSACRGNSPLRPGCDSRAGHDPSWRMGKRV